MKQKYDLIFSIGGSCCSAAQLKERNMRYFSLPFDWLFHTDSSTIYKLAECFKNDFRDFFLFENLKELIDSERGVGDKYQYKDEYTGYRFIHCFGESEKKEAYKKVKSVFQRRIERLIDEIKKK